MEDVAVRDQAYDIRSARRAVAVVFALHGAAAGSFFTRVPWIRDHAGLSPGALGLALVFPALGACTTMPLTSRIRHRLGGRAALALLLALFAGCLALPALAPNLPTLCVAMLFFGATAGMADVVMNANGVQVEERVGRSIMSGLHGLWSVGGLVASGAGALAAHADVDARVHLGAASAVLLAIGLLTCRRLLDTDPAELADPAAAPARFALPGRSLLPIGVVGFCAIFIEGASADWSGVYLRDVAAASAGVAAASYAGFAATMAATRLSGDLLTRRFGPTRTVRWASALSLLGGLLVVAARSPAPAIAGFALVGVGIAVVVPLAFAAAGRSDANPNRAIAGMATITYTAALVAPGVIGLLADVASLPVSFAVVTGLAAIPLLRAGVLAAAAPPAAGTPAAAATVPASGSGPGPS
jgi:MFS family permease